MIIIQTLKINSVIYPISKYLKIKSSQLNFYKNQPEINKTLPKVSMNPKAPKVIFQNKNP
jgi:hypothetical protein